MQDILKMWSLCWIVLIQNHLIFLIFELIARDYDPHMGVLPKFTFAHFTKDPNLHNPHLHKTHSYTTPKLHGTQIYTNPYFHNLKFTQPDFTQTQIYTLSVARGSSVRTAGRPA